jgi:adenosylcobyric acid synthase
MRSAEKVTLARCLMVQGTASGVGKSVLATALCRVLYEEGFRVAPFKAQNMSLNAAVTEDGGEIGRAQAGQAQAAGVAPSVRMNPILLKPEADNRSQLVVLGKVTGDYATEGYWRKANPLWPIVSAALDELRREFEIVVIEGAGSPAELNLRRVDLANMRVAAKADASVILVGDIERGGIFAQLLGTLDLLPGPERALVRTLIVNKFRGDESLFDDGVRILRERAGLPVYVLPFIDDLGVPSEDGLAAENPQAAPDGPEIAAIAYPHVSNHDDLEPLAAAGARIRYVRHPADLDRPDLIVLPGSKTTLADLAWLRRRGLAERICLLANRGTPVLGICGGFQMLGRELRDATGTDGSSGAVPGLALLPVHTAFHSQKRTALVQVRVVTPGFLGEVVDLTFDAYEIHVGQAQHEPGVRPFAELVPYGSRRARSDGAVSADGLIVGTYAHGLFADRALRKALLTALARRSGRAFSPRDLPLDPYARASRWLRGSIDVEELLTRLGVTHDLSRSPHTRAAAAGDEHEGRRILLGGMEATSRWE